MTIVYIIYAIIVFCILITVHELGHFLAAKAVGIRVNEFAIGMGPLLLHKVKGETEYSLRLLPIGGFCRMEGEDEDSEDPKAFNNKPFWSKTLVIVAGSFMNLILAIIIVCCIFFAIGSPTTVIQEMTADSPAAAAGLLPGDEILEIDGNKVEKWQDITTFISEGMKEDVRLKVEREGEILEFQSGVNVLAEENNRRVIGIMPLYEKSLGQSVIQGVQGTWDMGVGMIDAIGKLVTGQYKLDALTGPVGIVVMVGDTAKQGFIYVAQLTALISLNLAIVNMLPFPALDGGRLIFLIIRSITHRLTGKTISDEAEGRIHLVGMLLLFGLMAYITFIDINRIW